VIGAERRRKLKPEIEILTRVAFAEVAETLGVPTKLILSSVVLPNKDLAVLYTPHLEEGDEELYSVILRRGVDRILFISRQPKREEGMWKEMRRGIEQKKSSDG
jgi:hypothetical protein